MRRVRTSVGVAKMNFQQIVAGRSLKPTEVVVSSDPTAICRPFVRQRAQHRRPTTNCGYHGTAVITDRGYYRTSVNLDTQLTTSKMSDNPVFLSYVHLPFILH